MGVPKFFRYISERYPCLSELVKDYQIPEFDNLYLDMNGIIHNCSHPNDDDPHFRITEEKIFQDIFHYIEVLFRMIKPQKLFFMAIDGVAPRAKMNQQRGRRFRSAADAAKTEAEAIKKGEELPTEARFDSNCITPGTVFMAKLHEQLKYFVVDKISNDPLWQNCKVILSGHETPGEGEHKIMDYIRYMRAQPNYNPNTRHCLYGLDADLIMLGLCTHEPHFSLLREEVKFGKKDTKRITVPEEITFFLLHLSLLREYLELEFAPVKYNLKGFKYDIEKIIDDWVLMGFLVGNDFIPHLPNLHIAEGALPILYKTYMEVLPTLDGYINDNGKLNLKRFEKFLQKLGEQDFINFEQVKDDMLYLESKRRKIPEDIRNLEEWKADDNFIDFESLEPSLEPPKDSGLDALLKSADELCLDEDDDYTESDDDEFTNFKRDYYKRKLEYKDVTLEVLRDQAEGFVKAIQWNLNYYYNGCCSWSWFYPHHYSPYISDIKGFSDLNIEFDKGKPFHPYEQLLAVLPAASKQLLPECYHRLMTDENSKIIDYYPEKFECDLNGKKQAWEAVVKIPFIDEKLLLEEMGHCNHNLTTEEQKRNSHGPMLIYTYSPVSKGSYQSPAYFPEVIENHTEVKTMEYTDVLIPEDKLIKGAYPGAHMNTYYPGFPTMKHLVYKGELKMARVKVFEQPSRNESMIVKIIPESKYAGDLIPVDLLGTTVFIGWPHLIEATVVAISNKKRKFVCMGGPNQYNTYDLKEGDVKEFNMSVHGITEHYKSRMGIDVGETKVLVYVKQLIGKKYVYNPNGKLVLEKQFAKSMSSYPFQSVVFNIKAHESQSYLVREVENVFPKNSICFTLANPFYGSQGTVLEVGQVSKTGRIKVSISVSEEPDFTKVKEMHDNLIQKYKPAQYAASPLSISTHLFSKLTGAVQIKIGESNQKKWSNIGLDLKQNKKNLETPGYTKKVNNCWLYTEKVVDLVREYIEKFPEVIDCVNKCQEDVITIEKLFPKDCEIKFMELRKWLKSLPTEKVEKWPCNSIGLEPDAVQELEKIVDSFSTGDKKVTLQIKPNFLYRPEIQTGTLEPDPKTKTELLDRIVNVRQGYSVPFGAKGTITAIKCSSTNNDRDTMYEVVFDNPFRDGLKLNCSNNRGYMLPKTAFINISHGQRLHIEKTGKPGELIAKAEAYHSKQSETNQSSYLNNLIRPQPLFQQKSFPSQVPQGPKTISPSSSAFAYFSSNNSHTSPSNSHDQTNSPKLDSNKENISKDQVYGGMDKNSSENPIQQFFNEVAKSNANIPSKLNDSQPKNNHKDKPIAANEKPENWRTESKSIFPNSKQSDRNNCFMPNFGKNEVPANSSRTETVNTDYLRNILGIGKNDTKEVNGQSKPKETTSNVSFNMLAEVAKTPATVRLLTYYQSNLLGLPRYQYFNAGNNMISAQVTLNDGVVIKGKPCRTREEASEKVASIVLDELFKKGKTVSQIHHEKNVIPTPPVSWVRQSEKQVTRSPQKSQQNQKPTKGETSATSVLKNSLVPLQAVKSHISKTGGAANSSTQNQNEIKEDASSKTKEVKKDVVPTNDQKAKTGAQKPKRERKTRIAANFLNQK